MKSSENSQVDETIHKEVQRVKTVRKLSRAGGLSQSFRNAFKHKSSSSKTSSSSKSNLTRAESVRRKGLAKFFEKGKRMSKEQLVEKGIYRPEAVFGNYLSNLCRTPTGIPEFLERCVTRIEKFDATVGIYRINGDAAAVQKLRFEIDQDDYRKLESSENVSLLASTLKLFFRELPEPLISEKTRTTLYQVLGEKDSQKVVSHFREEVKKLGRDQARVLHFLFAHLHKVASVKENKMDARNLATVFSPNLVHCIAELRRPQSLISEMEMNNMIVENFITNVQKIFACDES